MLAALRRDSGQILEATRPPWVSEFLVSNNIDTGLTGEIIIAMEDYHELLKSTFAPVNIFTELPVSVLDGEGHHIRGTIDHLLELDDGEYIVIDHWTNLRQSFIPALHYFSLG